MASTSSDQVRDPRPGGLGKDETVLATSAAIGAADTAGVAAFNFFEDPKVAWAVPLVDKDFIVSTGDTNIDPKGAAPD